MNVCLQLFAYDEPGVTETMDRWAEQPTVHDVDYWGCVTPSTGDTLALVDEHHTFDLLECPPGKLSSRNVAHNQAIHYDVISVTDADAPPLGERTIDGLVEPYGDQEVVATNGFPTEPTSGFGAIITIGERLGGIVRPHMNGQLSSFRSSAWDELRDFDATADQTDAFDTRQEEEFWFYRALTGLGRVEPAENAHVYNDPRRWKAKVRDFLGLPQTRYGERRGVETFQRRK